MAAASKSLHTAIEIAQQGRHNPAVRRAAELVTSGKLGRLLSARVERDDVRLRATDDEQL